MTNYHDPKYGWPTTRCYPRTTRDAFPNDIENAQWWYPPERNPMGLTIAAIVLWAVIAVIYWKYL